MYNGRYHMKKWLTIAAIVGFSGMAVFSFMAMGHASSHFDCFAKIAQGTLCPGGPLAYVNFHLNAFRIFSTAVFGASILSAILLLLAVLAVYFLKQSPPVTASFVFIGRPDFKFVTSAQKRQFYRWLSLHEKRDPRQIFWIA